MSTPSNWFRRLPLSRAQRRAAGRYGPTHFHPTVTRLEDRSTPATITTSGTSAYIDLDTADEIVTISTSTAGDVSVSSDKTLTVDGTASNPATLSGMTYIEITDSADNVSLVFATSSVDYAAQVYVDLNNTPAEVRFDGTSSFGVNNLDVYAAGKVAVSSGATISATDGHITLDGNYYYGTGQGTFIGLEVLGSITTSGQGDVTLYGRGGADGGKGVVVKAQVGGSDLGGAYIYGIGSDGGTGANTGVLLDGTAAIVTSGDGYVAIDGTGGVGNADTPGVHITSGATVTAGLTRGITITGTGGKSGSDNDIGVYVTGDGTAVSTTGASIEVTGHGGGGSGSFRNDGVRVSSSGKITAGGTGTVTVTGTGGTAGSTNRGVAVLSNGKITTNDGTIAVTGTGGSGGGTANYGVLVDKGDIFAGGDGALTVEGTGGSAGTTNYGVVMGVATLGGGGVVSSARTNGADLTVTGAGTGGGHGLRMGSDGRLSSGGGGNLLILSDTVSINSNAQLQAGTNGLRTLTFRPITASTLVSVGGADVTTGSTRTLGLTDSELDTLFSTTLVIGDESTGDISIVSNVSLLDSNNVKLVSGGNIAFVSGGFGTGGGSLTLVPGTDTGEGVSAPSSDIDVTANSLQFANDSDMKVVINGTTVNTQYDQLSVLGSVSLTGANLVLSGTYTPVVGDVFDIVTASSVSGTFKGLPDGTLFTYKGVSMRIVYSAAAVTLVANHLPTNVSTGGPYTVGEGKPLTLTASATDADGDALQYTWDVNGDGVFGDEAKGSTPNFGKTLTFTAAQLVDLGLGDGPLTVSTLRVRASDGGGWVDSPTSTLTITNTPPTATAFAGSTSAYEGQTAGFGGAFTDPVDDGPYTYAWQATLNGQVVGGASGDVPTTGPNAGKVPDFVLTLPDDGTYLISLVVTDKDGGASDPAVTTLAVGNLAPTLTQFVVPSAGVAGQPVEVSAVATDPAGAFDPLTYAWTVLKNGNLFTTGVGSNVAFTPDGIGAYTVSLLVTDGDGGSATATKTVLVSAAPPPGAAQKVANARYAASFAGAVFVINPADGSVRSMVPFPGYTGEVSVAMGDLNGDGIPELVVGAGAGAAPHVKAFDGVSGAEVASFFAFSPAFTGGVYVAAGGGRIAVGAGAGAAPHVRVFDAGGGEVQSFFAYSPAFAGGVRVALGDLNGDGVPEVVTGAGAVAPHVKAFDGVSGAEVASFFAFNPALTGGVFVAAGGGRIAVGAGAIAPHVKVFDAAGNEQQSFFAFTSGSAGGARVALTDVDADGDLDLLAGTGPGAAPNVRGFTLPDLTEAVSFFLIDPLNPIPFVPTRGVFVA